jgi:hypothetical protein
MEMPAMARPAISMPILTEPVWMAQPEVSVLADGNTYQAPRSGNRAGLSFCVQYGLQSVQQEARRLTLSVETSSTGLLTESPSCKYGHDSSSHIRQRVVEIALKLSIALRNDRADNARVIAEEKGSYGAVDSLSQMTRDRLSRYSREYSSNVVDGRWLGVLQNVFVSL